MDVVSPGTRCPLRRTSVTMDTWSRALRNRFAAALAAEGPRVNATGAAGLGMNRDGIRARRERAGVPRQRSCWRSDGANSICRSVWSRRSTRPIPPLIASSISFYTNRCPAEDATSPNGEMESDEPYFGGRKQGEWGRGAARKLPVSGVLELGGRGRVEVINDM
jgi:hypothetical protein